MLDTLERVGISMDEVTFELQRDGVQRFGDSFEKLVGTIPANRDEILPHAR